MASLPLWEFWSSFDSQGPFALIAHREAVIVEATSGSIRVQHTGQLKVGSRVPVAIRTAHPVSLDARVASSHLVRIAPAPLYESRLEARDAFPDLELLTEQLTSERIEEESPLRIED